MHKSLALAALLLPFSGYGITKEARIKELKEAQYQKMLELRSIMDVIYTSKQHMDSNIAGYEKVLQNSARAKKEKLDLLASKSGHKKMDEESIRKSLDDSNNSLCEDLLDALMSKKIFKHSIFHELFDLDSTKPMGMQVFEEMSTFYPDKLLSLGLIIESNLMVVAVAKYHQGIQELIKINQEIIDLEA